MSKMAQNGQKREKIEKKLIFKRACNPKSQILTIFSTFFKSQKWSAQNEAIFELLGPDFQFFQQKIMIFRGRESPEFDYSAKQPGFLILNFYFRFQDETFWKLWNPEPR